VKSKLAVGLMVLGLMVMGGVSQAAATTQDTCTPPAGWTDSGQRNPVTGKIMYAAPRLPNAPAHVAPSFFSCPTQSAQELAAIDAQNAQRDAARGVTGTLCDAHAIPGHEAELAAAQQKAGLHCTPQPTPTPSGSGGGNNPSVRRTLPPHP